MSAAPEPAGLPYPPPARGEPYWPVGLTLLLAIGLQVALPDSLSIGPRVLIPAIETVLLLALALTTDRQIKGEHPRRRRVGLMLTALISAANIVSLVLLSHELLHRNVQNGRGLIVAGALIWLTNVLTFSLWYWEADRGGPGRRAAGRDTEPDFLFPQMTDARLGQGWRPQFIDYLYVSLTNATAFSPTDTMPLTGTAKSFMGVQALVSLVTIGLVVSRAVNIL